MGFIYIFFISLFVIFWDLGERRLIRRIKKCQNSLFACELGKPIPSEIYGHLWRANCACDEYVEIIHDYVKQIQEGFVGKYAVERLHYTFNVAIRSITLLDVLEYGWKLE